MDGPLYSGWGVRTMATTEGAYNPVEYHNGTVWPHDNAIIAAGLRRYGFDGEAARLASSILSACRFFNYRLPEVFAGYARSATHFPVEYPTASSPQAWAAGTPLMLISTLLGLQPAHDTVVSSAVLPPDATYLELHDING